MLSSLATFAPLKRKVFLEDLSFPGMGKAETGENFAGIILSLLFFHMREIKIVNMRENEMIKHSRNKMTKQAGRQNYIIFDANERKRN